jgi:hypothetical protein
MEAYVDLVSAGDKDWESSDIAKNFSGWWRSFECNGV